MTGMNVLIGRLEGILQSRDSVNRPLPRLGIWPTYFRRRNAHLERDHSFYEVVTDLLTGYCQTDRDAGLADTIEQLRSLLHEMIMGEPVKRPWALRFGGGYAELAADFRHHAERQLALNDLIGLVAGLALRLPVSIGGDVFPHRSGSTYYMRPGLAISDINRHFAQQAIAEDQIVSNIRQLVHNGGTDFITERTPL